MTFNNSTSAPYSGFLLCPIAPSGHNTNSYRLNTDLTIGLKFDPRHPHLREGHLHSNPQLWNGAYYPASPISIHDPHSGSPNLSIDSSKGLLDDASPPISPRYSWVSNEDDVSSTNRLPSAAPHLSPRQCGPTSFRIGPSTTLLCATASLWSLS